MIRVFAGDFAAQLITSEAKNYERFAHQWDSRGTVARTWTNRSADTPCEVSSRSGRRREAATGALGAHCGGRSRREWEKVYGLELFACVDVS